MFRPVVRVEVGADGGVCSSWSRRKRSSASGWWLSGPVLVRGFSEHGDAVVTRRLHRSGRSCGTYMVQPLRGRTTTMQFANPESSTPTIIHNGRTQDVHHLTPTITALCIHQCTFQHTAAHTPGLKTLPAHADARHTLLHVGLVHRSHIERAADRPCRPSDASTSSWLRAHSSVQLALPRPTGIYPHIDRKTHTVPRCSSLTTVSCIFPLNG